jgi:SAM-dependent methyltransferase
MYTYDDYFYDTVDYAAAKTAEGILRNLYGRLPVKSVLDLGCGRGGWLAWWAKHGAPDVMGVDGPYVDVNKLQIPRPNFISFDLTKPLALGRQFVLVETLEVAEHLSASAAGQFIDNLVNHGKLILFSAAVPGQGGSYHINERPWQYWREQFAARGYEVFDFVRPLVKDDDNIVYWYRHNAFLYAHASIIPTLPPEIRATHVPAGTPLANYLPGWVKLSTVFIRALPRPVVDRLARLKWQAIMWSQRLFGGPPGMPSSKAPN